MSSRKIGHVRKHMAQTIRSARTGLGMSQRALGIRAGVSGKFVGEVERELKSPSCDTLWRLVISLRRGGAKVDPAAMFPAPRA